MIQGRELTIFRRKLLSWFRQSQRELPWRGSHHAYRVWLSEIMLQQTRVAAVIPYYLRFLERFPNVEGLAAAPEEEVLRMWSGLGYYSRARNLKKAAQEIVGRFGGTFPRKEAEARELPGIGAYTAAAILSIAYGEQLAALDGNVARVVSRLFAITGVLREATRRNKLQQRADSLLDKTSPGDWNQAMMELGATVCTPRAPQCLLCPVAKYCEGKKQGIAERLPEVRKKREVVDVVLASAVFVDAQGRTLLLAPPKRSGQRDQHDDIAALVSEMWHFPTVAARGKPEEALRERVSALLGKKEAGNGNLAFEPLRPARHTVTYRALTLRPYRINLSRLPRVSGANMVPLAEVAAECTLAISNVTRKVARSAMAAAAATD